MNSLKPSSSTLENLLTSSLKPVRPRQDFVRGLGHRIQVTPPYAIFNRVTGIELLLFVLAGIISLGALIALAARFLDKGRSTPSRA